jgi:predicted O-methyltransferase YrrM
MTTPISIDGLRHYVKGLRQAQRAKPLVTVLQFAWNQAKYIRDFAIVTTNREKLLTATQGKSLPELVDLVMSQFSGILRPLQNRNELLLFVQRVQKLSPNVIVEIGTAKGGTFFLLSRAAQPNAVLVSIDLPGGYYGGGYPYWKTNFFRELIGTGKRVHFLRGNSHDAATKAELERILDGRKIDALFIDGDHSYQGVRQDFWLYAPLVRAGGLIALHDISRTEGGEIDVHKFWTEVRADFATEQILDPGQKFGFGIGIVTVPSSGSVKPRNESAKLSGK